MAGVGIRIVTTGGTIDKVYFDDNSSFEVGDSSVPEILREARVTLDCEFTHLLQKDSLHLTEEDRALIRRTVEGSAESRIVVTHGTDTMIETAMALGGIPDKVVALTGSLTPAKFRRTDAVYNVAAAVTAVQLLPEGVYVVMCGRVFLPERVRKNRDRNVFEDIGARPD